MNASVIMLAANVNDILSRYILIHDQIIKFSIRKLIPIPGLFKAIPFCTHENDLDALLGFLDPQIVDYLNKGVSKRSVAKILGCSPTTLYSWIRRRRISGR